MGTPALHYANLKVRKIFVILLEKSLIWKQDFKNLGLDCAILFCSDICRNKSVYFAKKW